MEFSKVPIVKRPLTDIEWRILDAVNAYVTFLPGSAHKRFIRDMIEARNTHPGDGGIYSREFFTMTEKQIVYLMYIAWRYRKRLPREIAVLAALKGGNRAYERKPDEERYLVRRERAINKFAGREADTETPDLFV
jgi:hypothetical protein